MKTNSVSEYNQRQNTFEVIDNPNAGKIGEVDNQDTTTVKKTVTSFDNGVVTIYNAGDIIPFGANAYQKARRDDSKIQKQVVLATEVKPDGSWIDCYTSGANGNRLHYVTTKNYNPNRQLVILVHGFPSNWTSWRHQIDYLDGLGYNVVALDTRGINGSERVPEDGAYNMFPLAADLQTVIDNLHYQHAFVVGHDWGAGETETLAMINQGLMAGGKPSMLDGVAMLSVPHPKVIYDLMDQPVMKRYNSLIDNIFLQGPVSALAFKIPLLFSQAYADSRTHHQKDDPINSQSLTYARRPFTSDQFTYYEDNLELMGKRLRQEEDPKTNLYPQITIPALRIWGNDDQILGPMFQTQEFKDTEARYFTNMQDEGIAGGHWINEQNSQDVNRLLGEFLKKNTKIIEQVDQ